MKKILLILIFSVFATPTFAESFDSRMKDDLKMETISENSEFKECRIRISGTYDGKKIDVTVTVEADNCATAAGDLLKAFAK